MDNKAILDELMGKDRNLLPTEKKRAVHFSDPEICKHFICGFCPSELFTNTKSDLGACNKNHDEGCKQEYQRYRSKEDYPFEKEFITYLERLVDELDRRIKRGHERLDHQDDKTDVPVTGVGSEKLTAMSSKIQSILQQIEDLGEEGKVDESQQLMSVIDQIKAEQELLVLTGGDRPSSISQQEKRMKVCEICGAFLVIGDTEKRISSHLDGKQHIGYALIRKTIEEYRKSHRDEDRRGGVERDRERDDRRYRPRGERDYKRRDDEMYDTRRDYRSRSDRDYKRRDDDYRDKRKDREDEYHDDFRKKQRDY